MEIPLLLFLHSFVLTLLMIKIRRDSHNSQIYFTFEVMNSGYSYEFFFMFFIGIVVLNGILLFQLTKKGDSKKEFIKTKSMAETLQMTIGVLVFDSVNFIFDLRANDGGTLSENPIILLFLISVFFLVSLLHTKRTYGGSKKKKKIEKENAKFCSVSRQIINAIENKNIIFPLV